MESSVNAVIKTSVANGAFPSGINNAFWFATFNALSFQIVLTSPMVLYAKMLGAGSTVLGIIAGMMPMLVILQIPAASYVPRVGYKRFVFGGWGVRVAFIFGIALVPLTGRFLDATNQLALVLVLLFGFNLSRGISSCAWLPWITSLVPPSVRGKYLVREAAFVNVGSCLAFLLAALCLSGQSEPWQFAAAFAFSAVMGVISLFFLKRIPEVQAPELAKASTAPVPWRAIAGYQPFRKLLWMNVGWAVAFGGLAAFVVVFLKSEARMSEGSIMLVNSTYYLGGLSSLWFLGSRLDRFGSKPVLTFSLLAWFVILIGWVGLAGHLFASRPGLVLLLEFLMGLAAALLSMANTRLAMVIIPEMGRSHFFAIFSVVQNLTLGLTPILWGLLMDTLRAWQADWLGMEWNRFTIFFAAVALTYLVTFVLSRRLEEPAAGRMEDLLRDMLIQSPQRAWLRFWPRG